MDKQGQEKEKPENNNHPSHVNFQLTESLCGKGWWGVIING